MDAWRTPDGRVLVAWKPWPSTRLPDGSEVSTFTFLLLDRGALVREYDCSQSSLEDWLYTTAYFVSDGALKCSFFGERYGGRETNEVSVELHGLVPVPAPAFEVLRSLVEARDSMAREANEGARRERDAMLDGFRRALREVPGAEEFTLSFALDGPDWVVRHGNDVWWRDGSWPWLGSELHRLLVPVVTARYAPRPARLEVDAATWQSLAYSND
ncbi:MAG: hypothetical protein Q8L14_18955 [Myxococcales bacterium]|nr:hypothetical protein [Myxococcales bacterium]